MYTSADRWLIKPWSAQAVSRASWVSLWQSIAQAFVAGGIFGKSPLAPGEHTVPQTRPRKTSNDFTKDSKTETANRLNAECKFQSADCGFGRKKGRNTDKLKRTANSR